MKTRIGIAACGLLGVMLMMDPAKAQSSDAARVGGALTALAKDATGMKTLTVTYDDLHGLHGGLKLTVRGDGRVEQNAVREKVGQPKSAVAAVDLQRLVALLVELAAWEQRVPNRMPVPDESRASLSIKLDEKSSTIWEWYNDLGKNQRIVRVRELMKQIAWQPSK